MCVFFNGGGGGGVGRECFEKGWLSQKKGSSFFWGVRADWTFRVVKDLGLGFGFRVRAQCYNPISWNGMRSRWGFDGAY